MHLDFSEKLCYDINTMHERIVSKERVIAREVVKTALLLVLFVSIITLSKSARRPVPAAQAVDSPLITMTNIDRLAVGLSALYPNVQLKNAANAKAEDILKEQYFDHYSPDGKSPWDFILQSGYKYHRAGENLAIGFNELSKVNDAWLASPGHKANILNDNFEDIGIGMSRGILWGREVVVIVQMFGEP